MFVNKLNTQVVAIWSFDTTHQAFLCKARECSF
jgi:hypothetical protein